MLLHGILRQYFGAQRLRNGATFVISGNLGDDAKHYQEKAVKKAIKGVKK